MDSIGAPVVDHGAVMDLSDVRWASCQLWVPDAAFRDGIYSLCCPAKDEHDIFRIGVATSHSPVGPDKTEPDPIEGSFSIDRAILQPVVGWTYHHSIVEVAEREWHLFYHDRVLSGGATHLRNVRVSELHHDADRSIRTIDVYQ